MSDTLTFSTPTDLEIRWTRAFSAPRALVFDALTKPEIVQRWMLGSEGSTMPVCDIDFKPGGTFRYVWRAPDGKEMELRGTYKEIARPERIVHTEQFHAEWGPGPETEVTTLFVEQAGTTTLTTTLVFPSREVRDRMLQGGMEEGIAASYEQLDKVLTEL